MNQLEVLSFVAAGRATWTWVPLVGGVEVMAWPVMVDGVFLSVSARTASACAAALNRNGWMVSLTTPTRLRSHANRQGLTPSEESSGRRPRQDCCSA